MEEHLVRLDDSITIVARQLRQHVQRNISVEYDPVRRAAQRRQYVTLGGLDLDEQRLNEMDIELSDVVVFRRWVLRQHCPWSGHGCDSPQSRTRLFLCHDCTRANGSTAPAAFSSMMLVSF